VQKAKLVPGKWSLDDVVEGKGAGMVSSLKRKTASLEGLRPTLKSLGKEDVESAMRAYESVAEDVARMTASAYMRYSADTGDEEAKVSLDSAEDLQADVDNRLIFLRLWWAALDRKAAVSLTPDDPDLRHFLGLWRKRKPFTLDEKVEQALNLKNLTGFSAWAHHYDKVVSNFQFTVKVRGKPLRGPSGKPQMVVDEVTRLFLSPDPSTREAAYTALLQRYAEEGEVLGEVYRTVVRDWWNENVKLRGFKTPIAPRNLENDVPDAAVETLLESCRSNAPVFQGFFRTKGKMLGMKRMSRYHIYAPLQSKEKKVGYGEAVSTVLDAFSEFDPRVAELARRVFERGHVDALPRKGKRNGAYCMSVTPSVVPYLFLNFAGSSRDVYTIAHESGHAVHSQLSSGHSVLTFHPPLVLAETASVFGEMILFDKYMREEDDSSLKKGVLLEKISSMYATIGRQAYFVVFENAAHKGVVDGAGVSDLCGTYLSLLREQFGNAIPVSEDFKWEWTYIPHIFHTPFYCYSYAFGNLLSLALYAMYKREGREFVPRYLKLLSSGGSGPPEELLADVGVDIGSKRFWDGGFDVIRRMVAELGRL
jgi:oligoendopeptidase F